MSRTLWILLAAAVSPSILYGVCGSSEDPAFNQSVAQGNYSQALSLVLRALHASPEEMRHFTVVQGLSLTNGDSHGQSDPDTLQVQIDPGLFLEGESGACQGARHELQHWRQFKRDRARLHTFYETHSVLDTGWSGCQRDELQKMDAARAEEQAYDCLEDNNLVPHAAAAEIEAVVEQVPYAPAHQLREEDLAYLTDHLKAWVDHQPAVQDLSNESFYLPEIKNQDWRIFCRGANYLQQIHAESSYIEQVWSAHCHPGRFSNKKQIGFP